MSFLIESWNALPLEQKFPLDIVPGEPWSGGEERFQQNVERGRELAGIIKRWRASSPDQPELEHAIHMLRHLSARRDALLQSWQPLGLPN